MTAFSKAIGALSGDFEAKGFAVEACSDYQVVLSFDGFSVCMSVDRTNPISLSGYVQSPRSNKYEIGLLALVLDKERAENDRRKLALAFKESGLDANTLNSEAQSKRLSAYIKLMVTQIIAFLCDHKAEIFNHDEPYRFVYSERSKERRLRMGLA